MAAAGTDSKDEEDTTAGGPSSSLCFGTATRPVGANVDDDEDGIIDDDDSVFIMVVDLVNRLFLCG